MKTNLLLASAASLFALSAMPAAAQLGVPPVSTPPVTPPDVDVPTGNLPQASARGQAQAGATASDRAAVNARAGTPPTTVTLDASGTIATSLGTQAQLSTLASAVTAADLSTNWNGEGPFTVFAPTNQAFELLSASSREQLMLPANKAALATILNYHVVPGRITAAELQQRIAAGGGTAQLETVGGQALTAQIENGVIVLTGANGSRAYVTQGDVAQANGMVHIVNGVLIPPA